MAQEPASRESGGRASAGAMDSENVCEGVDRRSILRRVHHAAADVMSAPVENLLSRVQARAVENEKPEAIAPTAANNLRIRTLIALPLAAAVAAGVHAWIASRQLLAERHYFPLLAIIFAGGIVLAVWQRFSPAIRRWMQNTAPII